MKNKGLFIIFEGTDGVGKTTSIKLIKKILENNYHLTAIYRKGQGANTRLGEFARKHPSTFSFLLESLCALPQLIMAYYFYKQIILQDRYFFSIIAHVPETKRWWNKLIIRLSAPLFVLIKPDLIFYLTTEINEQINRLKQTTQSNIFHQILVSHPELLKARNDELLTMLKKSHLAMKPINTSNKLPQQTTNQLLQYIKPLLN